MFFENVGLKDRSTETSACLGFEFSGRDSCCPRYIAFYVNMGSVRLCYL